MQRVARVHTALVLALVALVPLTPLALWVYARAASADRATVIAANERVFASVPHVRGARRVVASSYPIYRFGGSEGGLVSVAGYRSEFFLRLRRPATPATIAAHYRRALRGWREEPRGETIAFRRAGVTIEVWWTGARPRTYGFYVSQ